MCIGARFSQEKVKYLTRNQMKAVTMSQTDFRKKSWKKKKARLLFIYKSRRKFLCKTSSRWVAKVYFYLICNGTWCYCNAEN